MSEEEFFNAMDMDMDLSFLQPVDSPQSGPDATSSAVVDTGMNCGKVDLSSTRLLDAQSDGRKCNSTISHIEEPHSQTPAHALQTSSALCHNVKHTTMTTSTAAAAAPTKSLAAWTFNKKKRKRIYVSLTGQKLTGPDAIRQCREGIQLVLYFLM